MNRMLVQHRSQEIVTDQAVPFQPRLTFVRYHVPVIINKTNFFFFKFLLSIHYHVISNDTFENLKFITAVNKKEYTYTYTSIYIRSI
jgi:hypothetical protein